MPESVTVNKFVWHDLMTTDMDAAATFYKSVVGWGSIDSGIVERPYHLFTVGNEMAAGLMPVPPHATGMPPTWLGYVGVDDVDAMVPKLVAAGGKLMREPEDIPNGIGRFAVVSDPQGAGFLLFKPNGSGEPGNTQYQQGWVGWHELHTSELAGAWEFYSSLFGWTKTEAMEMGSAGTYQMFATGGPATGGMMTKTAEMPMPLWLFYFNVDAIDAAVGRIKDGGGQLIHGPVEVPGGAWVAQGLDPQGAFFAVVSMQR